MTTLAGLFFSLISFFGLANCKMKKPKRKTALIAISAMLMLIQILFINAILHIGPDTFIAFSGLLSGIIFVMTFQKKP